MTKYFFILGKNPGLSVAEILAILPNSTSWQLINEDVFVLENTEIRADVLMRRLGGIIKIGIVEGEALNQKEDIVQEIKSLIDLDKIQGKFKYGISFYGKGKFNNRPIGMEVKSFLRGNNKSARWVISKEATLSSVVVEQNKLASKGIEVVLIPSPENKKALFVGKTLAVQPFKELSYRDYGRPARDDYSGMIPPKLAQIMINLAQAKQEDKILDPFCGSGTIIMEAMLAGYKDILGSDISEKAVSDTKENTEWVKNNYQLSTINYQLFQTSATELSKTFKPNSVGAIITEPYLGPQRGNIHIEQVIKNLNKLYSDSIAEFNKILKKDGRVVMIWPVFMAQKRETCLNPGLSGFKILNPIPENLRSNKILKITNRGTIIYGREGQKVWREIVVLEKK